MSRTLNYNENCYARQLLIHSVEIKQIAEDPTKTLTDLQEVVIKAVSNAKYDKVVKPRFIANVVQARSKEDILTLCRNAVNNAEKILYTPKPKKKSKPKKYIKYIR